MPRLVSLMGIGFAFTWAALEVWLVILSGIRGLPMVGIFILLCVLPALTHGCASLADVLEQVKRG